MRRVFLLLLMLLLAPLPACSPLQLLNALSDSHDYHLTSRIPYGDAHRQTVDVYVPKSSSPTPRPVVVFFIGGRWTENASKDFFFVGDALASHGCIAVLVDQRFYPEVRFPVFEQDGAKAIAWTKSHIANFGGDPDKLFVMGYSSGAHTAAMLSLDGEYLAAVGGSPAWIRGTIGIAGPYDFLPLEQPDLRDIFGPPSQYARSQPINFVTPHAPPMLLLQGRADTNVNPKNATSLAGRLSAAGNSVQVIFYDKVDHYRIIGAMGRPVRNFAPTLHDVLEFVDERSQ